MDYNKKSLDLHKKLQGKISICSKLKLNSMDALSLAYTPGVAAVSAAIAKNKRLAETLTSKANTIAIVSDGSAVLGLGNIGPEAALPVMEGKSAILSEFAGVNAVPLCIDTKDTEEIIRFCKLIVPNFGGINLEDISAPRCFEILERLEKELPIPVFHDDQDGTAIAVLAALINACRVTNKVLHSLKVVVNGSGAAGLSIARLLISQGVKNIIILDSIGILYKGRKNMNKYKKEIAIMSNRQKFKGGLREALMGAEVFIGVSKGGVLDKETVRIMDKDPIIFALANPTPEIMPADAFEAGASIVCTGRSDFPNQINNALVFPGLFKGLLRKKSKKVTKKMKLKIALALAYSIKPAKNKLLPHITDKKVVVTVAKAV
jgi:malate dehydrogenase (oxaloacetate-decarboxylating)